MKKTSGSNQFISRLLCLMNNEYTKSWSLKQLSILTPFLLRTYFTVGSSFICYKGDYPSLLYLPGSHVLRFRGVEAPLQSYGG